MNNILWDNRDISLKTNNMFQLLREIFVKLWEKTGDKLSLKHYQLQMILTYYDVWEDLEAFLIEGGYQLQHTFWDIEELKYYISKNKDLLSDIKTGKLFISCIFDDIEPKGIVLAKKVGIDENIQTYMNLLNQRLNRALFEKPVGISL